MLSLIGAIALDAQPSTSRARSDDSVIDLGSELYFRTTSGRSIAIAAGSYRVVEAGVEAIELVSERGRVSTIAAVTLAHRERLTEPVAVTGAADSGSQYIVLFRADGTCLQALGSSRGSTAREGSGSGDYVSRASAVLRATTRTDQPSRPPSTARQEPTSETRSIEKASPGRRSSPKTTERGEKEASAQYIVHLNRGEPLTATSLVRLRNGDLQIVTTDGRQQLIKVGDYSSLSRADSRPSAQAADDVKLKENGREYGCAKKWYPASRRTTRQTKFAMPIPLESLPAILTEPAVVHSDHGPKTGELLDCESYDGLHRCYDGHEGTDFSLGAGFATMGAVYARAAASGIVIDVVQDKFDKCHINLDLAALRDEDSKNNVVCPDPDNPEAVPQGQENRVEICHPDGTISRYLHLMKNSVMDGVEVGAEVECGQLLGLIGSSGNSSAPHLHFDVLMHEDVVDREVIKQRSDDYVWVDPYSLDPTDSLWVRQHWDAGNLVAPAADRRARVPIGVEHPDGHPTSVACVHLEPEHDGHPGEPAPCLHPIAAHSPHAVMIDCLHPKHPPHGFSPCTHPEHDYQHHQKDLAGNEMYTPCLHTEPEHPAGHPTTLPCTHMVQEHSAGHPGPSTPCEHVIFSEGKVGLANLPGPACQ